jgi:hypothetical protein
MTKPTFYETRAGLISMARFLAKKVVRENIRRKGYKLRDFTVPDISKLAWDYVLSHPEIIAETKTSVRCYISRS